MGKTEKVIVAVSFVGAFSLVFFGLPNNSPLRGGVAWNWALVILGIDALLIFLPLYLSKRVALLRGLVRADLYNTLRYWAGFAAGNGLVAGLVALELLRILGTM